MRLHHHARAIAQSDARLQAPQYQWDGVTYTSLAAFRAGTGQERQVRLLKCMHSDACRCANANQPCRCVTHACISMRKCEPAVPLCDPCRPTARQPAPMWTRSCSAGRSSSPACPGAARIHPSATRPCSTAFARSADVIDGTCTAGRIIVRCCGWSTSARCSAPCRRTGGPPWGPSGAILQGLPCDVFYSGLFGANRKLASSRSIMQNLQRSWMNED